MSRTLALLVLVALALALLVLVALAPGLVLAGGMPMAAAAAVAVAPAVRRLSPYQERVLRWVRGARRGSACVVQAVAGSGKTFLLCHVAEELLRGSRPPSMVFLAFNSHIAAELTARFRAAGQLSEWDGRTRRFSPGVQVSTIHAAGRKLCAAAFGRCEVESGKYRLLARKAVSADLAAWQHGGDETSSIARQLSRAVCILAEKARLGLIPLLTLRGEAAVSAVADLVDRYQIEIPEGEAECLAAASAIALDRIATLVAAVLERGIAEARETGTVDFADMLWLPGALNLRGYGYAWVLVDEAQDLSPAQLDVAQRLRWRDRTSGEVLGNVLFVGDSNQAIYGFAGADCRSIESIRLATGAIELPLSITYRCPSSHVELAQTIVPHLEAAPDAIDGRILDCDVSQWLLDSETAPRAGDLVVSRRNAPLFRVFFRLLACGIPARVRGRDASAVLLERIDDAVARGACDVAGVVEFVQAWASARVATLIAAGAEPEDDCVVAVLDVSDCLVTLSTELDPECVSTPAAFRVAIESLCADPQREGEGRFVWLSSVHRAKGLEALRVHLYDAGNMRCRARTEEQARQEANLEYIALTRSRETMILVTVPRRQR